LFYGVIQIGLNTL